jgi:hypothetical protein
VLGAPQCTTYELARMRTPSLPVEAISFHPGNGVLKAPQRWGIKMVHQTHKGLPEPGDFRPGSWRNVVGLVMALLGLALIVGTMLTM